MRHTRNWQVTVVVLASFVLACVVISLISRASKGYDIVRSGPSGREVYVPPDRYSDSAFIQSVLTEAVKDARTESPDFIKVNFYDDRSCVPVSWPMTDYELRHWRAQYTWNADSGDERFVFLQDQDKEDGGTQIESDIRPGQ